MVSDEIGKRCAVCKQSIKVYKKKVPGELFKEVEKTFVDCKIKGTRLAYSMRSHKCKNYSLRNKSYTLDMENWEWILKEED